MSGLKKLLIEVAPIKDENDMFVQIHNGEGGFTIKSCYKMVMRLEENNGLDEGTKKAMQILWITKVPLKIKVFAWRIF